MDDFIEKLICPICRSMTLNKNFDHSIQCLNCLHEFPLINGIYALVPPNTDYNFSEIPEKNRDDFVRMKEMAYFKKSPIKKLYTHYHRYAMKQRMIFSKSASTLDIGFGMGEHFEFITPNEREHKLFMGMDLDRFKLEFFHRDHPEIPVRTESIKKRGHFNSLLSS